MKTHALGPDFVVVRCPPIDIPGARGFTVYDGGDFYTRTVRPLRMRCLVSEHLAAARVRARGRPKGLFVENFMRDEALAICAPQLSAARTREAKRKELHD